MNYKKTLLTTSIIAILFGTSQANDYISIISQEKHVYDVVENSLPITTNWADIGSEFNCVKEFNEYDFPLGVTFTQNENCLQKQERTITTTEIFNGTPRTTIVTDYQNIPVIISYIDTGLENYNTEVKRTEYTNWIDDGSHFACGDFSPLINTINLNEVFTQNRSCSQKQTRTETVYDIWADNSETLFSTNNEERNLNELEYQEAVGTKNFITGSQRTEYTEWLNNGAIHSCTDWIPLTNTLRLNEPLVQNRDCSQDQDRTKTVYDIWADTSETVNTTIVEVQTLVNDQSQNNVGTGLATSCKVILDNGWSTGSGIYTLNLPSGNKSATCDMTTDGGGWTVFQSRFSNSNFNQNWSEYKNGFGSGDNFWLGNEAIAEMTIGNKELYVELGHHNGVIYNARYSTFNISNEASKYTLTVDGHSGTQGDSLAYHSGKPFTTQDVDNDEHPSNCASLLGVGAWWHGSCFTSNLNGLYLDSIDGDTSGSVQYNINWRYNTTLNYSYKTTRMMFR